MSDRPDLVDPSRGPTASQAAGLTLAAACRLVEAVEVEARAMRVPMSVAVVDAGAQLVAFARMDGADLIGVSLAQDKAFTALVNRIPTGDLPPLVQPGSEFYGYDSVSGGRMIVFAGGMPLERADVLVGAVGVSGGSAEQDQRACDAAVRAFDEGLGEALHVLAGSRAAGCPPSGMGGRDGLQQPARCVGDLVDGGFERGLVGGSRPAVAAHLADVLKRGGSHLVIGCRHVEGAKRLD
jgi:uncharacterized protein GlcG (DUF336 family)